MTYLEARPGPHYETHIVPVPRSDSLGVEPAQPCVESVTLKTS